jgi:hypothetical protein
MLSVLQLKPEGGQSIARLQVLKLIFYNHCNFYNLCNTIKSNKSTNELHPQKHRKGHRGIQ